MLVFFIHGVSTKKSTYAEALIKNIKKEVRKTKVESSLYFYSSFWGNLFNHKKHQLIDYIDKDYSRACQQHPGLFLIKPRRRKRLSRLLRLCVKKPLYTISEVCTLFSKPKN
ncbi:MAG: hypothetical protein HEQ12_15010 [Aphanizomenon flos-aquae DEX188]|jgi:hypothetical protein|nr:MAG: hypothetical protein HEQ12_15010 [Aphanizomenon flos-aquae DEX188]